MAKFLFAPTPNQEAADFIKSKPLVSRAVFAKLLPELKARAFVISGIEAADVLQRTREALAELPQGGDWETIKKGIYHDLSPHFVDPQADAEEQAGQRKAAERRAELLLRTHGQQAYAAAQYAMLDEQRDLFPFWQYLSLGDEHVRETHAALDGIVLPADHEFWQSHYPPWEWSCRCQVVPLTQGDTARIAERQKDKPKDQQDVLDTFAQQDLTTTRRLVRNGVTYNVTAPREEGKPGAFTFHPGDLRISLDALKARYDAPTWEAFEKWARHAKIDDLKLTVWEWLSGNRTVAADAPVAIGFATAGQMLAVLADTHRSFVAAVGKIDEQIAALTVEIDAIKGSDPDYWPKRNAIIQARKTLREQREKAAEPFVRKARGVVALPLAERGALPIKGSVPPSLSAVVSEGRGIVESYVHPDLLPAVSFKTRQGRAFCGWGGEVNISAASGASTTAHEIVHAIEMQRPAVLQKSRDFLALRAGAGKPIKLKKLYPQFSYKAAEVTYEDEWIARKGNAYSGKLYGGDAAHASATELLTMGIERLHSNPTAFADEDPDYFVFVVNTLRNL